MNRLKDAEQTLPLIKAVVCENQLQEMLKFRVYYTNYVELYSLLKQPEKTIAIFPEIDAAEVNPSEVNSVASKIPFRL